MKYKIFLSSVKATFEQPEQVDKTAFRVGQIQVALFGIEFEIHILQDDTFGVEFSRRGFDIGAKTRTPENTTPASIYFSGKREF